MEGRGFKVSKYSHSLPKIPLPFRHSAIKNYFGVFYCYYAPGLSVKKLVMAGDFTPDDLFKVNGVLKND